MCFFSVCRIHHFKAFQSFSLCWAPRPSQPAASFFFQKTTRFCEAKYEVSPLFAEPLEWIAVRWDGNGEMEIHWPHLEAFDQKNSISWDFKKGWLAFFFAVWGMLWNVCLYFGVDGSVPGSGMLSATFPSFAFLPSTASIVAMGSTTTACRWFGSVTRQLWLKNENTIHLKLITDYKNDYGLKASWCQSWKNTPIFIESEKHKHFMEDEF